MARPLPVAAGASGARRTMPGAERSLHTSAPRLIVAAESPDRIGEMSDERLEALGLPRREFLKRAAALGVFAAPVIVSFGLAGTAEATTGCFPNQNFANQASTIGDAVILIWQAEQFDRIDPGYARQLRQKFLELEGTLLDENVKGSCRRLES